MIFRPDMNCKRMAAGADRMCMPEVPESMFIDAVKQVRSVSLHGNAACYVPPLPRTTWRTTVWRSQSPGQVFGLWGHNMLRPD